MAFSSVFTKANGFIYSSPHRSTSPHTTTTHTELEQQSERGSMSPMKRRTEKWLQQHHTSKKRSSSSGLDLRKVKDGRIARKNHGRERRKKRKSFWNVALWFSRSGESQSESCGEDELDGDTMIDEDDDDSGSAAAAAAATTPAGYDNDVTIVVDDYDEGVKGDQTRHALQKYGDRYLDYDDPRVQDWTEEERWLFTKLTNRGFEPLLHTTWILDYPTFPDQLFTSDESRVYINNIHGSIGRGTHSQPFFFGLANVCP